MASNTLSRTCDAGRPFSAALLDKGTFPWYNRQDSGAAKLLILLALRALPDNPSLSASAEDGLKTPKIKHFLQTRLMVCVAPGKANWDTACCPTS